MFIQVKSSRREMAPITTFAAETGHMNAIICCKSHDTSKRMIYSICDTDEGGRVRALFFVLYRQLTQHRPLLKCTV